MTLPQSTANKTSGHTHCACVLREGKRGTPIWALLPNYRNSENRKAINGSKERTQIIQGKLKVQQKGKRA